MKVLLLGNNRDKGEVSKTLISLGYGVYDLNNLPNKFKFSDIDDGYKLWSINNYKRALKDSRVKEMYNIHREVTEYCISCILSLPATDEDMFLSAVVKGKGKKVFIYMNNPLVVDVNHLFLDKILTSVEEVEELFKKKEEYSLSKLQSSEKVAKKPRQTKKETSGSIGKHNAKEFLAAQKEALRTGSKNFKFEGNRIDTDYSKHLIKYLTNKGWI